MQNESVSRVACLAAMVLCAGISAGAQQQADGTEPATLRVQSRLVIEDVLVMDKAGHPVHGLPASAFHIVDNGRPQQVRSFEEGSPTPVEPADVLTPLPPGTFSNALPKGAAPTNEILLIDSDDMALLDQMFLLKQLEKAIATMPAGLQASLFSVRAGRVMPVLLATTDRAALRRAAEEVLPIQTHAIDSKFQSAVNQLMTVSAFLAQTPGRKNLLWFAGEFPLVSAGGAQAGLGAQGTFAEREHTIHLVQEALAEARISVYPVDVRGVITQGSPVPTAENGGLSTATSGRDPRLVNAASQKRMVGAPGPSSVADQRSEMWELAATTGGQAYFLNNLSQEIEQSFDLGKSAYTLSYAPSSYVIDQSWHRVAVTVDGGYTVSYRKGYLATWTGGMDAEPRYQLVTGARQVVDPDQARRILFQAEVVPQADLQHVAVNFAIPIDQLAMQPVGAGYSNTLTVTTYAYDESGRVKGGKVQQLDTTLTSEQYRDARQSGKKIATRQAITLGKGAKFLTLIVRDQRSQRTGSLLLQTRLLDSLPRAAAGGAPGSLATGSPPSGPPAEPSR